jgi:hypothetical protein
MEEIQLLQNINQDNVEKHQTYPVQVNSACESPWMIGPHFTTTPLMTTVLPGELQDYQW